MTGAPWARSRVCCCVHMQIPAQVANCSSIQVALSNKQFPGAESWQSLPVHSWDAPEILVLIRQLVQLHEMRHCWPRPTIDAVLGEVCAESLHSAVQDACFLNHYHFKIPCHHPTAWQCSNTGLTESRCEGVVSWQNVWSKCNEVDKLNPKGLHLITMFGHDLAHS